MHGGREKDKVSAPNVPLFPGAAQDFLGVRCRPGIVTNSECGTIPALRSTAPQELRAAPRPGKGQSIRAECATFPGRTAALVSGALQTRDRYKIGVWNDPGSAEHRSPRAT